MVADESQHPENLGRKKVEGGWRYLFVPDFEVCMSFFFISLFLQGGAKSVVTCNVSRADVSLLFEPSTIN